MLQKGVIIFYKIGYIGYKIGYNLGHSYKNRYACYKSRYLFTGFIPSLTKVQMKIVVEARLFISRPLPLVYFVLVFT
jgi:hypothetical protein